MITGEQVLVILTLLALKHFIVDFVLQFPYQFLNKGTYGHPGGILHAALHIVFSFGFVVFFLPDVYLLPWISLCVAEGIVHYHIDWAKMNINKKHGWTCDKSYAFWVATGFDQFLHYLTYVVMVVALINLA